jgi:hypothetical protein
VPLHDWTDERGWDSVHPLWLTYLLEYVQERLPKGYKAFLGGVPALTVESANGKPDVSVRRWDPAPTAEIGTSAQGATSVLEPDLRANVAFRLDPQRAVHIDLHGQLIAGIELVSPRNKDRADAKETYTNRYLRLGVHLMLVDVLPRPKKFSFSDAITGALGLDVPALPPPFAAVYRVGEVVPVKDDMGTLVDLWRRTLQVGQPLPALPLPLTVHNAVTIDLEETYQRAAKRAYLE